MDNTVVRVAEGELRGRQEGSVRAFLGVPFARPPVGSLRFRPPQPPEPWTGVRDALEAGPVSMQVPTVLETGRGMPSRMAEDCLTLNVWAPVGAVPPARRRPVLVWVHGGAFVNGSGSIAWYDGSTLAARGDVVVVSVNYRLGALGFLHLAELDGENYAGSGNAGLLDQVAALSWVRDNIAAFGGDPDAVCLVGESAGAMSIGTLLATAAAKGLFHRAIMQSGTPVAQRNEGSVEVARRLFGQLGLPWDRSGLARVCQLPASEIIAAADQVVLLHQAAASAGTGGSFAWSPVVDGVILHEEPMTSVSAGASSTVPVLVGTDADEMRIIRVLAPDLPTIDRSALESRVTDSWGRHGPEILAGYGTMHPGADADDLWWSIASDRTFGLPTAAFIEARARSGAPTWTYQFSWRSPVRQGYYGSAHTMEIPFVFGTFGAAGVREFVGEVTAEMECLAAQIQDAWVAFATSGRPGTERLPAWPAVDVDTKPTMVLDEVCRIVDDPSGPVQALWAQVPAEGQVSRGQVSGGQVSGVTS